MIAYIHRMTGSTPLPSKVSKPVDSPIADSIEAHEKPVVIATTVHADGEIVEKLVSIVVKHTGYPSDFIELDQDLEGELGIDTVKQAEIMGDVRDAFDLPIDEEFVLSDHPTLDHFIAYIVRMKGGSPLPITEILEPSSTKDVPSSPTLLDDSFDPCRRWQVEVEECAGVSFLLSLEGTVVVTDDGWGIAEALCEKLESRGLKAVRVGFESEIRDMSTQIEGKRTVYRADPANYEHLAQVCAELTSHNVAGLIHMAPLKLAGASWNEDTLPSSQIALAAHGYFGLLKGLDSVFASRNDGLVASVTALDGRHGNIGQRFNAVQCAASGVTKSYSFEQQHLRTRALDVHPELILDAEQAASLIENELFAIGGEVEIGLDRDGRRWTLVAFAEDAADVETPL
jgi:acyl carrier protein